MKKHIRFGGAQIPVTTSLDKNVVILKEAIDWAADNGVDYLITPEGALSGYFPDFDSRDGRTFDDVQAALTKVVNYAVEKKVHTCIGTMWIETDSPDPGFIWPRRENQIRFYNKNGGLQGTACKTYTIPEYDQTVPCNQLENILLEIEDTNFLALGLLCNDFWGGPGMGKYALPLAAEPMRSHIVIHSSNGFRGDPKYDDLMNDWHNGSLRIMSWALRVPIITVDNCYNMNGEEYHGPTSSQSGVLLGGEWLIAAPRTGTQYFFYDFNLSDFLNYSLINPEVLHHSGAH